MRDLSAWKNLSGFWAEVAYGTANLCPPGKPSFLNHSTLSRSVCAQHTPTCTHTSAPLLSSRLSGLPFPTLPIHPVPPRRNITSFVRTFGKPSRAAPEPLLLCVTAAHVPPLSQGGHHLFLYAFKELRGAQLCARHSMGAVDTQLMSHVSGITQVRFNPGDYPENSGWEIFRLYVPDIERTGERQHLVRFWGQNFLVEKLALQLRFFLQY